jgi:hypothetical protein
MALWTDDAMISLDGTSVTMTLALSSDIDDIASGEDRSINARTDFIFAVDFIAF